MGRVSKYKKIKSCDPYSKASRKNGINLETVGVWGLGDDGRRQKKRSKTAQKLKAQKKKSKHRKNDDGLFDLPCDKDEFDMNDLMGSVKKQPLPQQDLGLSLASMKEASYDHTTTSTGNVASIPKTLEDETRVAKLLNLDQQVEKKDDKSHMQRQAGESRNQYNKRTKAETRQIIQKTSVGKRKTAKLEKKKEFLKQKKLKKKGKLSSRAGRYDQDEDDGYDSDAPLHKNESSSSAGLVTGERAVAMAAAMHDEPLFGEQAERPPIFLQLPRGAQKSFKSTNKPTKSSNMSKEQIDAEASAMALMRRKVQAQYAAIRAKRHQNGDSFHL